MADDFGLAVATDGKISAVRAVLAPTSITQYFATGNWGSAINKMQLWSIPQLPASERTRSSVAKLQVQPVAEAIHKGDVLDLQFVAGERFIVTASSQGFVQFFDLHSVIADYQSSRGTDQPARLKPQSSWSLHSRGGKPAPCTAISVQPNEQHQPSVATVGEDGQLNLLKLDTGRPFLSLHADSMPLADVLFFGRDQLATLSVSGQIKLWDVNQSQPISILAESALASQARITCLAVHPARAYQFVTGSSGGQVCTWDLRRVSEPVLAVRNTHQSAISQVCYHPNSSDLVFSCGKNGSVACSDMYDGNLRLSLQPQYFQHLLESTLAVNSLDILASSDLLICGTDDGVLLFKHVPSPRL